MKTFFIVVFALFATINLARAQWTASGSNTYFNGGKVGVWIAPIETFTIGTGAASTDATFGLRTVNAASVSLRSVFTQNATTGALSLIVDPGFNGNARAFNISVGSAVKAFNINAAGNVGIGIDTPQFKLHVRTNSSYDLVTSSSAVDIGLRGITSGWARAFRVVDTAGSNGKDGGAFGVRGGGATPAYAYIAIPTDSPTGYNSSKILVLNNSGQVGIGTNTPGFTLDINGTFRSRAAATFDAPGVASTGVNHFNSGTNVIAAIFGSGNTAGFTADQYGGAIRFNGSNIAWGDMSFYPSGGGNGNQGNFRLSMTASILTSTPTGKLGVGELYAVGNVGIGTTAPDAKLAVAGNIHAKEVKVSPNVPGPDYVFDADYKLTGLDEVKAYVEKYHHLPEIPSAQQMEKNGIDLGDMNMKLLKKVEELTLYTISLKKENNQLKSEQQKKNDEQETRIAALEKALSKLTNQ